jgi:peptidyl-prolyl cis-trans isomerase D
MLSGIRSAAGTWLGKIVLTVMFGFLIVSFAIWGIGDIFKGYGTNSLAAVGRSEIGVEAYRRAFQQRIFEIQQRSRGFTTEQARLIGLDRQVLNQMIGEAALNEKAQKLGLAMTTEETARQLAANQAFRGANGAFNRVAFDAYLREVGLTEGAFLQQQRQAIMRQHLGEAISGAYSSPTAMVEMLHRYRAEERTISHVVVPGAIPSALPPPTIDQLKALHEQRKGGFRAPEYRKFIAIVLSPVEFVGEIGVSDAELRQAYDRGIASGRFGTPEKRRIEQVVFPNAAEASAASERLKAGLAWSALLEERKLTLADVDLGNKTRAELADRAIAEAAFALAENAISAPVQGTFGSVLVRVTAIEPGATPEFASLHETLLADVRASKLANDRELRRKLDEVHDKIEELRSAGKGLQQVATELNRSLIVIEASDAQGRDKAGEPIPQLPDAADVLRAVFQSDRGVDNEGIRTRENGYVWFEIQTVEGARERSFDEVKALVEDVWRNDEAARQTTESANAFLKRLEAGETLEAIAAELGGSIEVTENVTRNGNAAIGASAAATAFALPPGRYAVAATGQGTDRMILRVDAVSVPEFKLADAESQSLKTQLDSALSGEILAQYVARLQRELGVTINERALAIATGAQSQR